MKQELVTKETNAVVDPTVFDTAWGAEETDASDIRIPKILLMQALSEFVNQDKANAGDIVNSLTGEVLAAKKETLNIVPIYIWKDWAIFEEINGKMEYKEITPYTVANATQPRELDVDGIKVQNRLGINVLCMLEKELGDPSAFPFVLSFRMTSMNAGRDVAAFGNKARMQNLPACAYTLTLGADLKKNDKGSFYVWSVQGAKKTENFKEAAPTLYEWYKTFKAGKAKVDESDLTGETKTEGGGLEEFDGQF